MRTLFLVCPPQNQLLAGFPYGLVSLADYVERHDDNVQVELIDLSRHSWSALPEVVSELEAPRSDLCFVGITTTTATYQAALVAARAFKSRWTDCVTVLGGHHAGPEADLVLTHHRDCVDLVVMGEGERALTALVGAYPHLDGVPNLVYRAGGELRHNAPAPLLTTADLDQSPVGLGRGPLAESPGKFDHVTYVSARGCPLPCAFCSVARVGIRAKSVARVVDDVLELVCRGYKRIAIEDNFFAQSARRTIALCEALKAARDETGAAFSWDCQTRVESLHHDGIVEAMASAGCEAAYIGVESFNADQLEYLGKCAHPETYLRSLAEDVAPRLHSNGVGCYINLQFGLPDESTIHHEVTLRHLAELGRHAFSVGRQITVFPQLHVVYPGTRHFQEGTAEGRFPHDVFEGFTEWESLQAPVLRWLGQHFAHGTGGIPEGILDREFLSRGRFRVREDSVKAVDQVLQAAAELAGVKVFQYGQYLVDAPNSASSGAS